MEITLTHYLIICPLIFLAGFADSIAGGGGIISLPAYVLAGMPLLFAYGTNKFAMSLGTSISAIKYYKSGNVRLAPALCAVLGALLGANIGARLAMLLDEKYLGYCMMVLLPVVAAFLIFNRKFGEAKLEKSVSRQKELIVSAVVGLFVGAYDGFFGPGAGTFYTLLFVSLLGYTLLNASGNARVVNLASNIGALIAYVTQGKVLFAIGIPAAVCAIAGNYIGSRLAIKNGARFIRPIMVAMVLLLFIKILSDYAL